EFAYDTATEKSAATGRKLATQPSVAAIGAPRLRLRVNAMTAAAIRTSEPAARAIALMVRSAPRQPPTRLAYAAAKTAAATTCPASPVIRQEPNRPLGLRRVAVGTAALPGRRRLSAVDGQSSASTVPRRRCACLRALARFPHHAIEHHRRRPF